MDDVDYRLIAIDLDGTLLSPTGHVTPRTRAAVHHAVEAGILVCFATGRSWRESRRILDEVGHLHHAVFVTGALVIDTKESITLHRRMMGAELAREAVKFFEKRGQVVLALQDSQQAGVDYLVSGGGDLNPETRKWLKMTETIVQRRVDLATAGHEHTLRVSIVADGNDVHKCHLELQEEFGGRAVCQMLVVPSSGMRVLEVFEPTVNKWDGVLEVARRHGIEPQQIVAVGDDVNDLPMIRQAGLGVAMGNAPEHVRGAAKRVIGHNAQDGLAALIEELVARHKERHAGVFIVPAVVV